MMDLLTDFVIVIVKLEFVELVFVKVEEAIMNMVVEYTL